MADFTSYIGGALAVVGSTPASLNKAGYEALAFVTVGKIVDISEIGDTSADVQASLLEGRVEHANGARDLGEISVTARADADDAGQTLLKSLKNTNTEASLRVIDPDGEYIYFTGKIANLRDMARNSKAYKGYSFVIRGNSDALRTVAP